jgi:hypothetical protein
MQAGEAVQIQPLIAHSEDFNYTNGININGEPLTTLLATRHCSIGD